MGIVPHDYNGQVIDQTDSATSIGNKNVPKGYVNLTQMCKANGKRLPNWTRLNRSKAYLEALSSETQIRVSQLLITIDIDGQSGLQGTWGHPEVAISISSWISPKFEVWANRVLRHTLEGNVQGLNNEARHAIATIQKVNKELRDRRVRTRRDWTDVIRDRMIAQGYYNDRDRVTEEFRYLTIKVNQALFGQPHFNCDRDTMTKDQQETIEIFERVLVRHSNKFPDRTPEELIDGALALF